MENYFIHKTQCQVTDPNGFPQPLVEMGLVEAAEKHPQACLLTHPLPLTECQMNDSPFQKDSNRVQRKGEFKGLQKHRTITQMGRGQHGGR